SEDACRVTHGGKCLQNAESTPECCLICQARKPLINQRKPKQFTLPFTLLTLMSGYICQRVEEWAADDADKHIKISGNPLYPRNPRPIAVTFNCNLLKEEAMWEMCPDISYLPQEIIDQLNCGGTDHRNKQCRE